VADDEWLTIGAVVARIRAAGYPDSQSTVRRLIDDGALESYRTARGHRRIRATSVDALIADRKQPGTRQS
jgi:excisionase family DNA binding protein